MTPEEDGGTWGTVIHWPATVVIPTPPLGTLLSHQISVSLGVLSPALPPVRVKGKVGVFGDSLWYSPILALYGL